MTNFTKEELLEIEKMFDYQAGMVVKISAETMALYSKIENKDKDEWLQRIIVEWVHLWDVMRTISAKAHEMQK